MTTNNENDAASAGSEYPLPWEVDSARPHNASVYAADSTPVCHVTGKNAKIRADLIVKFANQNAED